jgi:arylsulfatase A-like enzyme
VPTGWSVWHLDVDVSTARLGSVVLASSEGDLPRWDRRRAPDAWGWFYQPGGFVPAGFYLAVPEGAHPDDVELSYRHEPGPQERAERSVAAGRVPDATLLATRATPAYTTRPALLLIPGVSLEIPVALEEGDVLESGLGRVERPGQDEPGAARLRIELRRDDTLVTLGEVPLEGPAGRLPWSELRLRPIEGPASGLRFELVSPGDRVGPRYYLGDPRVVRSGSRPDARPHLLLVMIDGLRADRVSPELTPTLWQLAARGVRFTGARASAPWTRASVASVFTGLPPAEHGIESENLRHVLPPVPPTLAERLRAAGYRTAAFSANLHLHPYFGLDRGFESSRTRLEDGARVVDATLRWLPQDTLSPLFLFVFLMDTHTPYEHRAEFDRSSHLPAAVRSPARLLSGRDRARRGEVDPSPEEVQKLEALYEENVAYADARLADLLQALDDRGLLDRSVVVVTSDHGEAFGEHGDFFHGTNLHEELLSVPLIAAGPGLPRGVTIEDPVSLTWLSDALLALADGEASPRLDLRVVGAPSGEALVFETGFRGADFAGILRWPRKLIVDQHGGGLALFDLANDPAEAQNLAAREPELAESLADELRGILARSEARRHQHDPTGAGVDATTADQLRALGYAE